MGTLQYSAVRPAVAQSNLTTIAPYLFWLMFRNIASDGFVFEDPLNTGVLSQPGCVLASPSWENAATNTSQDYVYNWTRDAAITAIELAAGPLPTTQPLTDYVQFAQTCQNAANAIGHFGRASFLINGTPRSWTDQTDGPALQTLAILQLYAQLDTQTQATADTVIAANLTFLANAYQGQTYNLWEEEYGASFFARSVQLQCFQAITANTAGISVPAWLPAAIPWLQNALASHWNGQYYQSMLPVPADYQAPYDPNIDIVMAAIYSAIPVSGRPGILTGSAPPASPERVLAPCADRVRPGHRSGDVRGARKAPRGLVAFGVGEQPGPARLPDLVFQRELRTALPDQPRRDGELVVVGEELPGRTGGTEVVDHGHPDVRLEAERPDLADQLAAPELELALWRVLVRGRGGLMERQQAVTYRAAGSGRSTRQGPAAGTAVRDRHRGSVLRDDLLLTQVAAQGLAAVRAERPACRTIAGYLIPGHTRPPVDGLLPLPRPPRAGSRWLPASDTTPRSAHKVFSRCGPCPCVRRAGRAPCAACAEELAEQRVNGVEPADSQPRNRGVS